MKPALVSLVLLFLLLSPWPANTEPQENPSYLFDSGNAFLRTCKFEQLDAQSAICGFYVKGVADGFGLAELRHKTQRSICTRTGLSAEQAGRIVRKFIQDNPQISDLPVMDLSFIAFQKAFPCSNGK
jgi:hypothetical protein